MYKKELSEKIAKAKVRNMIARATADFQSANTKQERGDIIADLEYIIEQIQALDKDADK